jgi:LmbE family N-acetylglucosaminyl deacetylase
MPRLEAYTLATPLQLETQRLKAGTLRCSETVTGWPAITNVSLISDVAEGPAAAVPAQPYAERPDRLMVIVAHPDDADFGIAGSVAGWVRAGTIARLVCCTSGDAGADDASLDPLALAATREAEQRAAAEIVGYEEVTFLHRPDGALANDLALREQLVRLIRSFKPDAVLTMDPEVLILDNSYIQHTDHRQAGMAALDAVYPAARNALAFPHLALHEGLPPHDVNTVLLFFSHQPTTWVDISDTLETKIAALRAHASQLRKPAELVERISGWAAEDGQRIGRSAAEALRVVKIG